MDTATIGPACQSGTLDTGAAATYCGLSKLTMESWRRRGRGPKFLRLGDRVVYRMTDLDAWLERCVVDPAAARERKASL